MMCVSVSPRDEIRVVARENGNSLRLVDMASRSDAHIGVSIKQHYQVVHSSHPQSCTERHRRWITKRVNDRAHTPFLLHDIASRHGISVIDTESRSLAYYSAGDERRTGRLSGHICTHSRMVLRKRATIARS